QSRVQLPREESRGRLQDLVGTAQFPVLTLELHDPLRIHSGGTRPVAGVDLALPDPVTQRLPINTQPVSDPGDRTVLLPCLLPVPEHHPHGPLTDLIRVLPRCWHDSYPRKVGSLHRTRGGSLGDVAARLTRPRNDRSGWEQGPWSRSTARGRLGCCRSPCTSPGMLFPPAGY